MVETGEDLLAQRSQGGRNLMLKTKVVILGGKLEIETGTKAHCVGIDTSMKPPLTFSFPEDNSSCCCLDTKWIRSKVIEVVR